MSATAKFLFDLDFGAGHSAKPSIPLAEHAAKLAEAETAGYRKGHAAAEAKAKVETERQASAALGAIAAALDALQRGFAALEARLETEAVDVAVMVAKKLAPELIAREPFAEVSALVDECFRHLMSAPHVVVRVHDGVYETARVELAAVARARGFEGRLVVLADPDIAAGDCRIEWADGGVTRDRAATDAAINELIERYLHARRAAGGAVKSPDLGGRLLQ